MFINIIIVVAVVKKKLKMNGMIAVAVTLGRQCRFNSHQQRAAFTNRTSV